MDKEDESKKPKKSLEELSEEILQKTMPTSEQSLEEEGRRVDDTAIVMQSNQKIEESIRKKELFALVIKHLPRLIVWSAIFSLIIAIAVVCGSNGWLITLAIAWITAPTVVLGCMLSHILGKAKNTDDITLDVLKEVPYFKCAIEIAKLLGKSS